MSRFDTQRAVKSSRMPRRHHRCRGNPKTKTIKLKSALRRFFYFTNPPKQKNLTPCFFVIPYAPIQKNITTKKETICHSHRKTKSTLPNTAKAARKNVPSVLSQTNLIKLYGAHYLQLTMSQSPVFMHLAIASSTVVKLLTNTN